MSQRRFGVELEFHCIPKCCNSPKCIRMRDREEPRGRQDYDDYYYDGDDYGAPDGWHFINRRLKEAADKGKISQDWWRNQGHDGSGIEVRSPILQGTAGFRELRYAVNVIVDAGGQCNDADGLHVHHDGPEFKGNKENTAKLIRSWMENQEHIYLFVEDWRLRSGWCDPWNEGKLDRFLNPPEIREGYGNWYAHQYEDGADWYAGDHGDLNIDALTSHGSVEIRLHEGTLDIEKIEAWVRFGQKFMDSVSARKNPIAKCPTPEVLMNRVGVPKKAQRKLAEYAGIRVA